jgi:hypothetical protein
LDWDANQLVFIDESAANERSAHRKFGWAPTGATPVVYTSHNRSKRWSILPAYTADGFMVWDIVHGSYNKELFLDFIRDRVLPLCNPYPGPKSILIMDNAPIHRSDVNFNQYLS